MDSLSTYIGYIADPAGSHPVSVRVVEPPPNTRQHIRGSLFAVVEVNGANDDADDLAEHLLNVIQRTYYSIKGSQSQVLQSAVEQARVALREIGPNADGSQPEVGIVCAALLRDKLMVSAVGLPSP